MNHKFVSTYVHFVQSDSAQFERYLLARREDKATIKYPLKFSGSPLFYPRDEAVEELLGEIQKKDAALRESLKEIPSVAEREFMRACLVEEVIQTNEIEGVFSTRKDIYRIMDDVGSTKKLKVRSITNKYQLLLSEGADEEIRTLEDIRKEYDQLMEDALAAEDKPDGQLFRKDVVSVTNGIEPIHNGLYPEERIQEALKVFLQVSLGDTPSIWERLFIAHYIFEFAHPFYDGNGRCGRYLMTRFASKELPLVVAFRLATAIGKRKSRYYKAFTQTQDVRNRSDLSTFVYPNLSLLSEEYDALLDEVSLKKEQSRMLRSSLEGAGVLLNKDAILSYLADVTSYASFGVRIEDIAKRTGVSVITVKRHLSDIETKGWLIKEKVGFQTYFRLNADAIG
ncbi:MAG: Fic family protein [Erysipelotrichaceae bacterium]|nr:Fic family protein [Erysipelotrichaceae bacterium]